MDREKAIERIIKDKVTEIVYAGNSDSLEDILLMGWVSLEEWSDEELNTYLETIDDLNEI